MWCSGHLVREGNREYTKVFCCNSLMKYSLGSPSRMWWITTRFVLFYVGGKSETRRVPHGGIWYERCWNSGFDVIASHLVATETHTILFINIFLWTARYPDTAYNNTQQAHELTRIYVTYGIPINLIFSTRMLSFVCHDLTQTVCTNEVSI